MDQVRNRSIHPSSLDRVGREQGGTPGRLVHPSVHPSVAALALSAGAAAAAELLTDANKLGPRVAQARLLDNAYLACNISATRDTLTVCLAYTERVCVSKSFADVAVAPEKESLWACFCIDSSLSGLLKARTCRLLAFYAPVPKAQRLKKKNSGRE